MKNRTITIVHMKDLVAYPPVLSLIENLLNNGNQVNLVGIGVSKAPNAILDNKSFSYKDIQVKSGKGIIGKIKREYKRKKYANKYVSEYMCQSDVLWTTTDISVRTIPKICRKYADKHIMQLMELEEWYPRIIGINLFKFPIDEYARTAKKVVVPEINRAYIQKVWWNLPEIPYVLPNKPYKLQCNEKSKETKEIINRVALEKRKIILYLGIIAADRNLDVFADAIEKIGQEYVLYIAGKIDPAMKEQFSELQKKHKNVIYLGNLRAPEHLALLKYTYIGLTPYYTGTRHQFISPLNVLYCAPNKIYEYSGFGIPMIGTNVLGLIEPFEKYHIGICCKKLDDKSILNAIDEIDKNYTEMSNNCLSFYNGIDLDKEVEEILS